MFVGRPANGFAKLRGFWHTQARMNKFLSLWAAVFFTTAGARAQTDLIARIHFLGGDKISADPASAAFTNEFCSAEAKALESQTLDKLSRAPGNWYNSKIPAGATNAAALLRPLLDDLLKSEWVFEIRDTTNGSPEYTLAIRPNEARYQLWDTNLMAVFGSWAGPRDSIVVSNPLRWEWFRGESTNHIHFAETDGWVLVDGGGRNLSSRTEVPQSALTNNGWLSVEANWPRLAQLFPALKAFDFPKIAVQVVGRGGNLQVNGKLTLSQPLPPPGNWRIPTNLIHQPLISFTAARGIGPWLSRQSWAQPYQIRPMPDQLFLWAMPRVPFESYAAFPVSDAPAALSQLGPKISAVLDAHSSSSSFFKLAMAMTNSNITFTGAPFVAPFVTALRSRQGDFVAGGFFPISPPPKSPPTESFAQLASPGLVFYHWENTSNRLALLPQLSQLILMMSGDRQLGDQSAAFKWLARLGPTLGETVTEVAQTGPSELTFKRSAAVGLTAVELTALANWLEAPNFPGCDLALPPMPVRSGQRPPRPLPLQIIPAPH